MSDGVVRLTRRQVREVDRRAIEEYHVPGIVLMENAVIGAKEVVWDMLDQTPAPVTIVCGGGNNGGDGLGLARHLFNAGIGVEILVTVDPGTFVGDALINWRIVSAMEIPTKAFDKQWLFDHPPALIVDAIFGTGLSQPPREPFTEVAGALNESGIDILAIDLPSGLDCDTGEPLGDACVRARRTVTFVAEKAGFANPGARRYTGKVMVADIGCPNGIVAEVLREVDQ